MIINRESCPFCNSKSIKPFLDSKDYSHSKETFSILQCESCTGAFTQNIPSEASIGSYYNFDAYVSHNNNAKGFINNLYLKARNYTLNKKIKWLKKFVQKSDITIADIGAGSGAFVSHVQFNNINAVGFEPDATARQAALKSFNLTLNDSVEWFTQNKKYDAVTLWHVLEHLHQLDNYLDSFYNALDNDGKLFIAVPNFLSTDAKHYKTYWAAYDVPRHLYHFNQACMAKLAAKFNFTIVSTIPMWLDAYYVSMLSEKHKNASLGIIKGLIWGAITHLKLLVNKSNASSLVYVLAKK